jgi:sterol desaturase/sphingolipid hydroxylase (fatty acid hydroxylase superfamily)
MHTVMVVLVVLFATFLMMLVERARPGRSWPSVSRWLLRAWTVSGLQALVVLAFGASFDAFLAAHRPFVLDADARVWPVLVGYVTVTFVFYFWHRARHRSEWLWRFVHQLHHSPQRLEVITSFYKHPIEIVLNSVITGSVLFLTCGLTHAQAAGALALCGLGELFYHWNVRTPRWLGYFIQRPEMHCEHHREGAHRFNYGDLPIWDILFGTFHNPARFDGRCGFGEDEQRVRELMLGGKVA